MRDVLHLLIALLACYFLVSGLKRVIQRTSIATRWHIGPPRFIVIEHHARPQWQVLLGGIIRLVIAGVLILFLLNQFG